MMCPRPPRKRLHWRRRTTLDKFLCQEVVRSMAKRDQSHSTVGMLLEARLPLGHHLKLATCRSSARSARILAHRCSLALLVYSPPRRKARRSLRYPGLTPARICSLCSAAREENLRNLKVYLFFVPFTHTAHNSARTRSSPTAQETRSSAKVETD
jgi:hypothetical protein